MKTSIRWILCLVIAFTAPLFTGCGGEEPEVVEIDPIVTPEPEPEPEPEWEPEPVPEPEVKAPPAAPPALPPRSKPNKNRIVNIQETPAEPAEPVEADPTEADALAAIEQVGGRVFKDTGTNAVTRVFLNRSQATDETISMLKYLPTVEVVNLTGTKVTDAAVSDLQAMSNLKRIYSAKSGLTDAALTQLELGGELQVMR